MEYVFEYEYKVSKFPLESYVLCSFLTSFHVPSSSSILTTYPKQLLLESYSSLHLSNSFRLPSESSLYNISLEGLPFESHIIEHFEPSVLYELIETVVFIPKVIPTTDKSDPDDERTY